MEPIIRYLIAVNICIVLFYAGFLILQKKEHNSQVLRTFLLLSIFISLVLPLSKYKVALPDLYRNVVKTTEVTSGNNNSERQTIYTPIESTKNSENAPAYTVSLNWKRILISVYLAGSGIVLLRFLFRFLIILSLLEKTKHKRLHETDFLTSPVSAAPFSFLQWIFIPENLLEKQEVYYILTHEKAHVNKFHSFDIIIIELLLIVFWYNPVLWMLKKSIELVHEYQADEEVVKSGYCAKIYQELLVNLVAEEKLISLSSGFSKSIIFKRIKKMKQPEFNQTNGFRLIVLLPIATILFLVVSCLNGQKAEDENMAVIAPSKMNVLYAGVGNPMDIAVSGHMPEEIEVSATNATIIGENGRYIITPQLPGNLIITLTVNNDTISKADFRVKLLPEPYAYFAEKRGGSITKDELLKGELKAEMAPDFDFSVDFKITHFTVDGVLGGFYQAYSSNSNQLTEEQKAFLQKLTKGTKIYFTDIECIGPDGNIRNLSTIDFIILNE